MENVESEVRIYKGGLGLTGSYITLIIACEFYLTQQRGAQRFENRRQNVRFPQFQNSRTHDRAVTIGAIVGAHAEGHQKSDHERDINNPLHVEEEILERSPLILYFEGWGSLCLDSPWEEQHGWPVGL
uniref:Uncharacterized protein n=1 Tax=Romanomermis culicivorax TaxID=13658 RepID=A0A915HR16_ROMCU